MITYESGEKIRILFVIGQLVYGGAEKQLVHLANSVDRERYEPMVCSFSADAPLAEELVAQGVKTCILPKRMNPDLTRPFTLYKLVKDFDPDLIHSCMFVGNTWSRIVGLVTHKPVIISERSSGDYKPFWMLFIDKLLYPLGALLIVNSESGAESVRKRKEFRPQKIKVIYNGIPFEQYAKEEKYIKLLQEFGIQPGGKVIAVVGRLSEEKNHELIFYALQKVLGTYPDVHLLCVGSGPRLDELKKLAKQLDIDDKVIFTGYRSDIPSILSAIDLLVLASKFEGVPNVLLEAMAAARPIVATSVGGVPEIITDGETGLLVPSMDVKAMAEAIIRILTDENMAQEMGRKGQEAVKKNFSVERMVSDTEKVYEGILRFHDDQKMRNNKKL